MGRAHFAVPYDSSRFPGLCYRLCQLQAFLCTVLCGYILNPTRIHVPWTKTDLRNYNALLPPLSEDPTKTSYLMPV